MRFCVCVCARDGVNYDNCVLTFHICATSVAGVLDVAAPLRAKRTLKYLLGVSCGCWVLSSDWLRACLGAGYGLCRVWPGPFFVECGCMCDFCMSVCVFGWLVVSGRVEESPFEVNDDGCSKEGPRMSRLASTRKVRRAPLSCS